MSETREPTLLMKLWHTPFSDLARCRMTRRLDWRRMIEIASISDEIKTLLIRIVRQTRL